MLEETDDCLTALLKETFIVGLMLMLLNVAEPLPVPFTCMLVFVKSASGVSGLSAVFFEHATKNTVTTTAIILVTLIIEISTVEFFGTSIIYQLNIVVSLTCASCSLFGVEGMKGCNYIVRIYADEAS